MTSGITGLVGDNGVGKSVLLRLAEGGLCPTAGSVERLGRWHAVAQQAAAPAAEATASDVGGVGVAWQALDRLRRGVGDAGDLALADGHWDLPRRWQRAMAQAGLAHLRADRPAAQLSVGQRCRVALAGAFLLSGADGLLLDEPTNHLDREGRRWLLATLARWPGPVLVATHDRELLEQVDRIAELTLRGLHLVGGGWPLFQARRAAEAAAAEAALRHARAEREAGRRDAQQAHDAQLQRAARGRAAGRDTNQSPIVLDRKKGQAQAFAGRERQRQEHLMERLDAAVRGAAARLPDTPRLALALPASAVPAGKPVLELAQAVPPHAPAGQPSLTGIWQGPVRIAITGPNGCGKSTLLRLAAGALRPASGLWRTGVRTAWLGQSDGEERPGALSVLERLARLHSPLPLAELRTRLAQLGLDAACLQRPGHQLSGGQRVRATLACALWGAQPAQMLLLDEPTNHLDTHATELLEQALQHYPGALMVVSHDTHFLAALRPQVAWTWAGGRWDLDAPLEVP
ncbi:ATP-binding cassette domain-containing protein [Acidovorax sp. FG27]|uniref:ATP-binding cassette domain-containing protein n=1 Tax=Acidovorax sp. FG27 TaxID=3133652 RepID=UPI0030E805F3